MKITMKKTEKLENKFVTAIPEKLQDGILYISIEYATVAHLCCCGCRREVVTPLSPTDWKLTYDGVTCSLNPSIGNWSFPCKSHYWIREGTVRWAEQWSTEQIQRGREYDRRVKTHRHGNRSDTTETTTQDRRPQGIWNWVTQWWRH